MRLLVPAVLLGVSLTLGAAIGYEAAAPLDPVTIETPHLRTHGTPPAPTPYVAPPEELFADIDARPLFSSQRQPLQDMTQTGPASVASSDFVLAGVIMGSERAVALLRSKSTSATMSALVGDVVNGWRVAKIDATTVTLRGAGGEFVVPLDSPANQPASPPLQSAQPQLAPAAAAPSPAAAPAAAHSSAQTAAEFPLDPIVSGSPKPPGAPPTQGAAPANPTKPPPAGHQSISPEALKGAPIDPSTGEPTL